MEKCKTFSNYVMQPFSLCFLFQSQEALRLEELLHHCSDLDSFDADDYATLLTILIHNATSAPNIQR